MEGGYDTDGKLTHSTVTGGSAAGQVYYLCDGEKNVALGVSRTWTSADRTKAAAELGDAFTDETSGLDTVRYELKVSGLSSYTFPRLKICRITAIGRQNLNPAHWPTTNTMRIEATASTAAISTL
ncbi:MAG: hypothetical protein V8R27_04220 [Oscillospiraceae bacterium]